jgi:hypothetical protein
MWDMLACTIHVLDARCGPYGYNLGKKERHELIVDRLHDALFDCYSEFFAGWPIKKSQWGTNFPMIVDTYYKRYFCKLYIIPPSPTEHTFFLVILYIFSL